MRHPQGFAAWVGIGEAAGEKAPRGFEPVEFQRQLGTLKSHARKTKWGSAPSHHNRVRCDWNNNRYGL